MNRIEKLCLPFAAPLMLNFVSLAGCHSQTLDEQFDALCMDQKAHDPAAWATTEWSCENKDYVPADQKRLLIKVYAQLKAARTKVGQ